MHYMFYGCKAKLLNLSSFDTSKLTTMQAMLEGCKAVIKCNDSQILGEYHKSIWMIT